MDDRLLEKKLKLAILKGAELLKEQGLGDWKIKLNRKRAVVAQTDHPSKTIFFSKYFVMVADKEQFVGVTLHEATHALLGRGKGPGREFVELCTKISPNDKYAKRGVSLSIRKYLLTCPECGQMGSMSTMADRYCGQCSMEGGIVKFDVSLNQLKVRMW
jgi:ribosomal protein S27AE